MKHSLRNILLLLAGIMIMLGMSGCATQKYKLNFNSDGFKASRPAYAAGERVTVYYNLIGTDTDYKFDVEGVEWTQDYNPAKGYILRFVMPARDVNVSVNSTNTMYMDFLNMHNDITCPADTETAPDLSSLFATEPETAVPDNADIDGTADTEALSEKEIIAAIQDDQLLFDYYESTVATVGGDGYDEFVLYPYDSGQLILASYSKWFNANEKLHACLVPASILDECMAVVEKYDMRNWNGNSAMTGQLLVVKFREDDHLIRISSDVLPSSDTSAFSSLDSILSSAWRTYGPEIPVSDDTVSPFEGPFVIPAVPATEPETTAPTFSAADLAENEWLCPFCGNKNAGRFCSECGSPKPAE